MQSLQVLFDAVAIYVKDTKRKQFTTYGKDKEEGMELLRYMSKIQKESNSQLVTRGCSRLGAVAIYVKDTKRKQFTTIIAILINPLMLLRYMSKIQKESNSQQSASLSHPPACCCDICQRYKKKAIHNLVAATHVVVRAVAIYVKDTKRKQFTT